LAIRTAKTTSSKQTVVTAAVEKKYVTFETPVSTDDTIPITELTDILGAALFKKSDGTAITFTEATNIITVTQATLTNVDAVGFAYGT
jgi:hypothetical protein